MEEEQEIHVELVRLQHKAFVCNRDCLGDVEDDGGYDDRKQVQEQDLLLTPGPESLSVLCGVAQCLVSLGGDGQGAEDGDGEGGVVQGVQHRPDGVQQRHLVDKVGLLVL